MLVLGGSQGAQQINKAMPEAAARLFEKIPELSIVHQAGARNLDETKAAARAHAGTGTGRRFHAGGNAGPRRNRTSVGALALRRYARAARPR